MHVYIDEMKIVINLSYWHKSIIFLRESIDSLTLSSIPLFTVTITKLVEYRCSFISRFNLLCNKKYIVASTLKTSVQRVFKGFLWFFKLLYDTFYPFAGWIKIRMFKNRIHIYFNIKAITATFWIGQPFCYRGLWQNEHRRGFCIK